MNKTLRNTIFSIILTASCGWAQPWTPWQIPTPRQTLPVSGDGSKMTFSNVVLPNGMTYHVHAENRIQVSTGSEIADARYYFNIFPFLSGGAFTVGLKMKNGPTEDYFSSTPPQVAGYQSNHIYDASVACVGSPLIFRMFDRGEPGTTPNYYADNSGAISVTVSRETPGLAVKRDTLFFPPTKVGQVSVLTDSIQGYGEKGYLCESVVRSGANPAEFAIYSQNTTPFVLRDQTNEFRVSFTPSAIGSFSAEFHLISSTAYGADKERIIYVIGTGIQSIVKFASASDTLDFGVVGLGTSRVKLAQLTNVGNISASAIGISLSGASQPYTVTGLPVTVAPSGLASLPVTFTPTMLGTFIARCDISIDDGSTVTIYFKGVTGIGIPSYTNGDTLRFGIVKLGTAKLLQNTFINIGDGDLIQLDTNVFNNDEYTVITNGNQNYNYTPGSANVDNFIFTPKIHIPNYGNHDGYYQRTFTAHGPHTIYFLGADHIPLLAELKIPRTYTVRRGDEVTVSQYLVADLTDSYDPLTSLSEVITFDQTLFDFVRATKGKRISGAEWTLTATPGAGQVTINLSSTTGKFTAGGEIVKLTFRPKMTAPFGSSTELVQIPDFANKYEPLTTTEAGKITVTDICTPVQLTSGIMNANFIEQNSPNPFNPTTKIRYQVSANEFGSPHVSLRIYDGIGRLIRTIVDATIEEGIYDVYFDGHDLPSGVYTYVYQSGDYTKTRRMILAK